MAAPSAAAKLVPLRNSVRVDDALSNLRWEGDHFVLFGEIAPNTTEAAASEAFRRYLADVAFTQRSAKEGLTDAQIEAILAKSSVRPLAILRIAINDALPRVTDNQRAIASAEMDLPPTSTSYYYSPVAYYYGEPTPYYWSWPSYVGVWPYYYSTYWYSPVAYAYPVSYPYYSGYYLPAYFASYYSAPVFSYYPIATATRVWYLY
jgi:hypothetical protein